MKTYLIIYQFANPSLEILYNNFYTRIKSYQYWARPMQNAWLIKTLASRDDVMTHLRPTLLTADKILIMNVNNDWISLNLETSVVKWMQGGL